MRSLFCRIFVLLLLAPAAYADVNHEVDTANWIALPISTIDGFFPTAWGCPGAPPATQLMIQFHQNWHCNNPDHTGANWGNRFFGFHKQFLLGYDRYLASVGEPYVQTWVAAPNAIIPPAHGGRPNNASCTTCVDLPNSFRLPSAGGTLDGFATVTAIGDAIVSWHNTNHGRIAAAGGTGSCAGSTADMNCPSFSTRDPIFYRYHHIFDDVQNAWRTYQPTDISIVFDRSGSMSLPTNGGGTRLDAAKSAASLFADLLEDGSSHHLGMVSFSTAASAVPDMPLTNVAGAPAAMTAALALISASGATSIGDGLQKGQALVASGSNPRKAMLLLTDGMENQPPTIASSVGLIGDTHVCAVGLGMPGSLDGPKLRDLSERQGGIYISTPNPLELKKFFVFCFADIFDSFVGEDPIATLAANQLASPPTVHQASGDEKIAFVLSWTDALPAGSLRLAVTTPSGLPVDLTAPDVESVFGPTWHIVRVKTPYRGERDGQWTARAVRPVRGFVNGFSSNAFEDLFAGAKLVHAELSRLCATGCKNILYYEDEMAHETFEDHNTVYGEALYNESGRGIIGAIQRPRDAKEFLAALQQGRFDLLVYSSQFTQEKQPYDGALAQRLCSDERLRFIVSDNRKTEEAGAILRCAGALRGEGADFSAVQASELLNQNLKLREQMHAHPSSYEIRPAGNSGAVQAQHDRGGPIVIARAETGRAQDYFITALTRSAGRVRPFTYRARNYTFESLHPTFQIPEPYRPVGGYDRVEASVDITRPARGESDIARNAREGMTVSGDNLTPRQAAIARASSDAKNGEPTVTKRFPLFDDGTNGDGTKDDRYWEVAVPADFASVDGEYHLHAHFVLCRKDACVTREAEQTLTVEPKLGRDTKISQTPVSSTEGRRRSRIVIDARDTEGKSFGTGLLANLDVQTVGDVKVERTAELQGGSQYEVIVSYTDRNGKPGVTIGQYSRPKEAFTVKLP